MSAARGHNSNHWLEKSNSLAIPGPIDLEHDIDDECGANQSPPGAEQ